MDTPNTDHVHDWKPLLEHFRRYACTCGATGYRHNNGQIVAHQRQRSELLQPALEPRPVSSTAMRCGGARLGRRGPGSY